MKRFLLFLATKLAAFGISGGKAEGLKRLFITHPPLDECIADRQAVEARIRVA